ARAVRGRVVAAVEQAPRPRHAHRGRREADARPEGDRRPGGAVPAEEGGPREQGPRDRAAAAAAEEPGAHARRGLEGPARLRLAQHARRNAGEPEVRGAEQQPGGRRRLHQRAPAQRLVPDGRPRQQPGGAEHRELLPDRQLQGPGSGREGKGHRRSQGRGRGRRGANATRAPRQARKVGRETEMADNALTRLPLAGQLGVSAVIAALICGGFYYLWYADALEQQRQKEAKLSELQKEIRALEATANRLPEFQREVQALEARLETLKRILPPEKEMPDLMRRIQYLAAQSSLQIRKFNPATVVQKEFYQEVPVSIDLEGTYHNMGAFLDRVSRMSRLVN